jgi:transmembrane protein TMEM220
VVFRTLDAVMTALFAFSVAVQFNDPDPARWMAIYAAACAISIVSAVRGVPPLVPSMVVGGAALAWGVVWMATSQSAPGDFLHMFDAWEMKSMPVEEAREAGGLMILMVWMIINALRARLSDSRVAEG